MDLVLLGARLRKAREDRRMSQDAVAAKINMTRSYVGHIEAGRREAPLHVLEGVAGAVGLKFELVLRESSSGVDSEMIMLLEMATPEARGAVRSMLKELAAAAGRRTA